jgi:hypothetical protein
VERVGTWKRGDRPKGVLAFWWESLSSKPGSRRSWVVNFVCVGIRFCNVPVEAGSGRTLELKLVYDLDAAWGKEGAVPEAD